MSMENLISRPYLFVIKDTDQGTGWIFN